MIGITLKQLRYFDSLARHGHFGKAADACAISQPALSMQIKELEETLNTILVERGPRRVRLTTVGRELSVRATEILRSVDELGELTRASHGRLTGQLRIGVIPTIAPYLLPSIIGHLSRLYPDVDVHVRETMTSNLLQELADGRIDTAVVALPVSEPTLTEVALFQENFVLVRPETERDKPIPDRDMLREMRLLLLEEGHCFRDQALSFCNFQSTLPRETLDATSLSTLVQMVGAGIGVTLIPEMAVDVETRSASVSIDHFGEPQPSRTVGMIWRKSSPLAQQYLELSEIIRETAKNFALIT